MGNSLDYLTWRGDLPLEQVPFCDVDALVFSRLVYVPFLEIVPDSFEQTIPLDTAAAEVLRHMTEVGDRTPRKQEDISLLRLLIESPRFSAVRLCGYAEIFAEETQEQFCAMTALLPDKTAAVLFRGTDGTLIGWKEDFNMSFCTDIPAQRDALAYLIRAAQACSGELRLMGHSKGGNLSMYAGAFCPPEVQCRIRSIRNLDGPGFREDVLDRPEMQRIVDRTRTYLPQSSVIGMLLEHRAPCMVNRSSGVSIFQHDTYLWEIRRGAFVFETQRTDSSQMLDRTFKDWLGGMTDGQREKMIDGIFHILAASDGRMLRDLWNGRNTLAILKAAATLDEQTRTDITTGARLLKKALQNSFDLREALRPVYAGALDEARQLFARSGKNS